MKTVAWSRLVVATIFAVGALCPPQALAQVPARFYWKSLSDANAVPVIINDVSGNTNPFDPAHIVSPGGSVDATVAISVAVDSIAPSVSVRTGFRVVCVMPIL